MSDERKMIGRLAMRVEGDNWVAYYAQQDTMEGAIWLGSIRMAIVQDTGRKRAFMYIMKGAVSDLLKDALGADLTLGPSNTAPEHEKTGRA